MTNIYNYLIEQKNEYPNKIHILQGYDWSMEEHVRKTVLYKNSQLTSGKTDDKPIENIILPILRLQYRAEGFDVKDINLFVNDEEDYYKSLLVRKFHEKWAREVGLDTFIDELVETYVDFGGVLVKNIRNECPEVVHWESIAFCDQTDFMSGPFAIKHAYSPDQLLEKAKLGWGDAKNGANIGLNEVVLLAENWKTHPRHQNTKTPGKYIEVYEIHGTLPRSFLEDGADPLQYVSQMQIVVLMKDKDGKDQGLTLYKSEEPELPFKLHLRDEIYGRSLGLGGAEELFEAQVWTNYDHIRIKGMLDAASKVILKTTDEAIQTKHPGGLSNLENLEIIDIADGKTLDQVNTVPAALTIFEANKQQWTTHANTIGSATGALLGEMPTAHTSFNTIALVTSQGQAIHDYRKGQLAVFLEEIYRDWILPYITKELTAGTTFLAELDLDELQEVADSLTTVLANDMVKKEVLAGRPTTPQEVDEYKQKVRAQFMKGGNKRFLQLLKNELKDTPTDVEISIANKQKDLGKMADALTNIIKFAFSTYNPQDGTFGIFQDPRLAELFNQVLEMSGLEQLDSYAQPPKKPILAQQPQFPQPIQSPPQTLPNGRPTPAVLQELGA